MPSFILIRFCLFSSLKGFQNFEVLGENKRKATGNYVKTHDRCLLDIKICILIVDFRILQYYYYK